MHKYTIFDHNWLVLKINNMNVQQRLPDMKGVVYDFGCGTRPYETDIMQFADRYVGVDWSNTLHGLDADVVANLNEPLPIEGSIADTVVSFQVLEHLSEPQTMINEAFRILRPGGRVFLSVPFQWHVHEAPYDFYRYTCYGLEYIFKKSGFVDIKVEPVTGFWTMWLLKLNYQTARIIRGPKFLRVVTRIMLVPFWWLDQHIADFLDRIWPKSEGETVGYFVTARRP